MAHNPYPARRLAPPVQRKTIFTATAELFAAGCVWTVAGLRPAFDDSLANRRSDRSPMLGHDFPQQRSKNKKYSGERIMTVSTILLIIVVLMLVGAVPAWPHSRGWGYGPSGALGTILLILVVLLLLGRI